MNLFDLSKTDHEILSAQVVCTHEHGPGFFNKLDHFAYCYPIKYQEYINSLLDSNHCLENTYYGLIASRASNTFYCSHEVIRSILLGNNYRAKLFLLSCGSSLSSSQPISKIVETIIRDLHHSANDLIKNNFDCTLFFCILPHITCSQARLIVVSSLINYLAYNGANFPENSSSFMIRNIYRVLNLNEKHLLSLNQILKVCVLVCGQVREQLDEFINCLKTSLPIGIEFDFHLYTWENSGFSKRSTVHSDNRKPKSVQEIISDSQISRDFFDTINLYPEDDSSPQYKQHFLVEKSLESLNHADYDVIMRVRPDLLFKSTISKYMFYNALQDYPVIYSSSSGGIRLDMNAPYTYMNEAFVISSPRFYKFYASSFSSHFTFPAIYKNQAPQSMYGHVTTSLSLLMQGIHILHLEEPLHFLIP